MLDEIGKKMREREREIWRKQKLREKESEIRKMKRGEREGRESQITLFLMANVNTVCVE